MERKVPNYDLLLASQIVLAISALAWFGSRAQFGRLDIGFAVLFVVIVALTAHLRSQLPRFEPDLVLLNVLVITTSFLYGGDWSVVAAGAGFAASCSLFRWLAGIGDVRETLSRTSIAAIAATISTTAANTLFGSPETVLQRHELVSFLWFLGLSTIALGGTTLLANWLIFNFAMVRDPRRNFSEIALRTAAVFSASAFLAGGIIEAIGHFGAAVVMTAIGAGGIVSWAIHRYRTDVRDAALNASSSALMRAKLAEEHVKLLKDYVEELEVSTQTLQKGHEDFRHAAFHDALTGLPNRNFFMDKLKLALERKREKTELNFAILLLDLNRFKTINDSLGHSMGDRLIQSVAKRLSHLVRDEDMVARFSGDKFGVILTDLLMKDEATAFADRMMRRIAEPYTLDGRQVFTNVKIGIAFGNSKYAEAEDILRDADIAMYYAKDNEENYVIFDQKMHIRAVTRLQLETDLRFAIERNEFELHYQPIIGLDSADLIGFEALVRWNHPQRGLIPPNEFIPITESTGLIVPITIQILHSTCEQIAKWQDRVIGDKPLSVAVNISGKHFAHPNLVDQIKIVLAESGINPACLKLELTESAIMENADTAISMLKEIKSTGVQISIDDFGTGYSSLSYLHRFPIDLLKVDRSFVSAMESNSENGEIVRTVIALAKALKLKVVAEGIESIHQFHQLRVLGCEYGQGYLFSKPLPVAEIEKLLGDRNRWKHILPPENSRPPVRPLDLSHFDTAQ